MSPGNTLKVFEYCKIYTAYTNPFGCPWVCSCNWVSVSFLTLTMSQVAKTGSTIEHFVGCLVALSTRPAATLVRMFGIISLTS